MKKLIFIMFITCNSLLFSQETLLEKNKDKICHFFEQEKEFDSIFTCADVPGLISHTLITHFEEINLKYYMMGYALEGSRVYICYSYNGNFELFSSKDFDREFNEIFKPLIENGGINVSSRQLLRLVKYVKLTCNRNNSSNGTIKYASDWELFSK